MLLFPNKVKTRAKMRLLCLALILFWPRVAYAQVAAGNSCTITGATAIASNANGYIDTLYCNGTTWAPGSINLGTTTLTCSSGNAGALRLYAAQLQFCDGSNWQAATTTAAPLTIGYFVLSNVYHDGNLGGLSGANASCRSELSAGAWQGKPAALDTSKVFAFLCDSSTCQNPVASTQYIFALVGNTAIGGATFFTDNQARGPNDQAGWNGDSYFGNNGPSFYWTGRGDGTGDGQTTDYLWSNTPSAFTCSDYTSNSSGYNGRYGAAYVNNSQRYSANPFGCNYTGLFALICFVNP